MIYTSKVFVIDFNEPDQKYYAWYAEKENIYTYSPYGVCGCGETPQESISDLINITSKPTVGFEEVKN